MDTKALLEIILSKEGANEALQELSAKFNIKDSAQLKNNWSQIEELLINFRLKRYSISQDFLFSETIIQPFRNGEEIEQVKRYLLN